MILQLLHVLRNFTLVLVLACFCGCHGDGIDCSRATAFHTVKMDSALYKVFPYKGNDTITFLYNGIDTVLFYGGSITKISRSESDDRGVCNPENTWTGDGVTITFRSPIYRESITISNSCAKYPNVSEVEIVFRNIFSIDSYSILKPKSDSILVAGKYFTNALLVNDIVTDSLFYNSENGILKFHFLYGELWELIKK